MEEDIIKQEEVREVASDEEEQEQEQEESPIVQFVKPPEPEEEQSDGMEDLFEVNREELTDTKDVVAVDIEEDILDAGEDGSIEDVTTVTEEDIMGDDMYGQSPLEGSDVQEQKKKVARVRRPVRIVRLPRQNNMEGLSA